MLSEQGQYDEAGFYQLDASSQVAFLYDIDIIHQRRWQPLRIPCCSYFWGRPNCCLSAQNIAIDNWDSHQKALLVTEPSSDEKGIPPRTGKIFALAMRDGIIGQTLY